MFTREQHGLGFTKYVLKLCGYKIRLHVWHSSDVSRNRHNHGWSFISIPIIGKFIDNIYVVVPGVANSERHSWSTADAPDAAPAKTGRFDRLELLKTCIRRPFIPYRCRFRTIHNYYPDNNKLHMSLVLVGKVKSDTSHIWPVEDSDEGV